MNIPSYPMTETFVAAGRRTRDRGWGASTALSIALAVAGLAVTSSAQAWGVCGRGPWVEAAWFYEWAAQSMCSCSNGQRGTLMVRGRFNSSVYVAAWGTASGGGAGGEMEAWDLDTGEVVWIGMDFRYPVSSYAIRNGYESLIGMNSLVDPGRYERTGRYRSVCITNQSSLPPVHQSETWFWD